MAILFCEPSCLSAMRDDVPVLLHGEDRRRAELVARSCVLFEEFVEQNWAAGRLHLGIRPGPPQLLLHGHRHQKAMGLLSPAVALLSRIPQCTVIEPDAGCCGMAGSFGYLNEHFELSRRIGELRLLPVVRNFPHGTPVVASGTSCRHQIRQFTNVAAVHAATLLRSLL